MQDCCIAHTNILQFSILEQKINTDNHIFLKAEMYAPVIFLLNISELLKGPMCNMFTVLNHKMIMICEDQAFKETYYVEMLAVA